MFNTFPKTRLVPLLTALSFQHHTSDSGNEDKHNADRYCDHDGVNEAGTWLTGTTSISFCVSAVLVAANF